MSYSSHPRVVQVDIDLVDIGVDGVRAVFNSTTGEKVHGQLEMAPDEVLYFCWERTQSPKISDAELRRRWKANHDT